MVVESPPPQEQPLQASTDSLKASLVESQAPTSEPGPMATTGESTVNGVDSGNESQRQQHPGHLANGVSPAYPYPPPPGSMYPMGMPHEMFQGGPGVPGQRMMLPMPYPYPPPQPGQPGQPMPPNGYAFPTMMQPPPAPGNGNASPSSPSAPPPMPPYGYGMWYPAPGAPPPGSIPQNGMQPIPMPMGAYPPPQHMYLPPQHHGDGQQNGGENGGPVPKPPSGEQHTNGVTWTPGPGGLPPKAVAQTIPCRYFPDCRFGSSCWFLHPGADSSNTSPPSSNQQDQQPPRPFFTGPLPPPVRYGPSGPWDPSSAPPNPAENSSDANKSSYPSPMAGPNAGSYGLIYAPYPYPNGYPPMYPPPTHSQQSPNGGTPQSPPQPSQPMSPQHIPHQLQQNPPSQPQSPPPPNMPAMYQVNGTQGGWYPGQFPPSMPVQGVPMQSISPSHHAQGMVPMSPVSPSMGPNGTHVQGMVMPAHAMSPNGAPMSLHSPQHHPGQVPYPISPPYTSQPMHPLSPPQQAHPLSPQTHPVSPQSPYGNQISHSPSIPVMPQRGHHSRRESMSSMSAVPMGQVLGPHLDGNGAMDGPRSPPSAFREMMDGGFPGARRGRGGHSSRGSWAGGGSFGPARKTPCAFYPSGKCKNGDQCRFPHIMPTEGSVPVSPTSPRGGYPGSFGRVGNGSRRPTILGPTLEDKMADLSVKEVDGQENGDGIPRTGGFPKMYSSSPKTRGGRPSLSTPSTPGHRQPTHLQSLQQQQQSQRIPSADDFPVLGGTATPPPPASASVAVGNGHGYASAWSGPTAAQVLKSGMTAKKSGGPHATGSSVNGDAVKATTDGPETTTDDSFRAPETTVNTTAVEAPA